MVHGGPHGGGGGGSSRFSGQTTPQTNTPTIETHPPTLLFAKYPATLLVAYGGGDDMRWQQKQMHHGGKWTMAATSSMGTTPRQENRDEKG